jgi:hypothetical protein
MHATFHSSSFSATSSSSIHLNLLSQLLLQHQQSHWGTTNNNLAVAMAAAAYGFIHTMQRASSLQELLNSQVHYE